MTQPTRVTLIERIKNRREEGGWDDFVSIYRPYIYMVLKNLGVKHEEIDDLIQTVFVTCWKKLPDFDYDPERGKFRYWICRIATWACNNHFRKTSRRNQLFSENMLTLEKSLTPEIEKIADREWKSFISTKAWENVRKNLSGKMLSSYDKILEGKSLDDIAAELDVAENTVAVYRSRIEKKIVSEIQKLKAELE
jgi:RNA polymerase sigma factor (sigma-70 family)